MLDVVAKELIIIKKILAEFAPHCEVWAFGSRAKGTTKKHSDLDLVIISDGPLGFAKIYDIKEAFAESDLPFRVDVVDWSMIDEDFRAIIRQQYVVIQEP